MQLQKSQLVIVDNRASVHNGKQGVVKDILLNTLAIVQLEDGDEYQFGITELMVLGKAEELKPAPTIKAEPIPEQVDRLNRLNLIIGDIVAWMYVNDGNYPTKNQWRNALLLTIREILNKKI